MQENYHGRLFMTGILSLLFILVILLIGVIFVTYRSQGTQTQVETITQTQETSKELVPTAVPTPKYNGTFFLHVENDQREFSVGDTINIELFADSDGQAIVGYDLDLDITGGAVFTGATSLLADFDMHPTKRTGGVYLTSLKSIASQETTVLADSAIATITLSATAPGTVMIAPKFVVGETSHSNLMSMSSESVLGSVEGVSVTVH